ncbi:MAG: response regulator [Alphaproteobacteria bacterium]|nr:MAG: response regulator [Alphaproteobacteria bacterium]
MSDAGHKQAEIKAGPLGGARRGWPLLSLVLAALLALACAAVAWHLRGTVPLWLLASGGVLAFLGLVVLFGFIAGIVHIGPGDRNQAFFNGLMDAMGDACVVTDAKGRAVYGNAAYLKLVSAAGLARLVGIENIYTGYPEVARPIYRLSQSMRERRSATEEIRLNAGSSAAGAKTHEPVWIRISVSPIETEGGAGHSLWRHQDISADRAKQEGAFSHLQYIINYLDQAPAGFFSADAEGRIAYINATLAEWLGLDLEATTGGALRLKDVVSETGAKLLTGIAPSGEATLTELFDIDLKARDGRIMPVRIIHRTGPDKDGRLQPSRSLVLPQSAKGANAADTAISEARLSRFFNTAPMGIAELDGQGIIRNANLNFIALSPHAKRGAALENLVTPSQRAMVRDALAALSGSGAKSIHVDVSVISDPPRSVQFMISGHNDKDASFLVFALDTTENKSLEVQVAQGQKMQAIGQLAGGVAHDFNNVLTAIIGFSDLLLAKQRPTDPAFADIMNIKQNANRAANLVRQLLAFSRRQTLRPELRSLTDVISDLGNLLGRLLGEKVELKVVHGRDIGMVKVDVNQFEQVIINLAVNARDAMPNGGTLTVRTSNASISAQQSGELSMPPGEYVLCEVEDTGTGIPKDIFDKIWEPFFSTKDVGKGTGLGLSTVYGIIKQTGGFIFCDSVVGQGTVFRIYLPRHHQDKAALEEAREERPEIKRADHTGKGTILLVEDEDAVRAFASRALASRGYTVLEAASGEVALQIVAEKGDEISLVISDVVMPEMDGPTLLKELRKRGVATKVIFISGYAEDAFEKNLEGELDFAFLPKPFSLKQLAEAVKDVMGS